MTRIAPLVGPALSLLASSCISNEITVTSIPPGAAIVRDGLATGLVTPARLSPFSGSLTVSLAGHRTPDPLSVRSRVATERIVITVLMWPVGAILWGFQFTEPEQSSYDFVLQPDAPDSP